MKIFSIKNEKLNFFNRPIYCESAVEALSYVQNILMSDADRALFGLKDDLALYELGEINFETGAIWPCSLLDAIDYEADSSGEPIKICTLRDIFDTIPAEKLHVSPTREEMKTALAGLSDLSNKVKELFDKVENLEKSTQKGRKK